MIKIIFLLQLVQGMSSDARFDFHAPNPENTFVFVSHPAFHGTLTKRDDPFYPTIFVFDAKAISAQNKERLNSKWIQNELIKEESHPIKSIESKSNSVHAHFYQMKKDDGLTVVAAFYKSDSTSKSIYMMVTSLRHYREHSEDFLKGFKLN